MAREFDSALVVGMLQIGMAEEGSPILNDRSEELVNLGRAMVVAVGTYRVRRGDWPRGIINRRGAGTIEVTDRIGPDLDTDPSDEFCRFDPRAMPVLLACEIVKWPPPSKGSRTTSG